MFSGRGEGGSEGGDGCRSYGSAPPDHSSSTGWTSRRGGGSVAEVGAAADAVVVVATNSLRGHARRVKIMITELQSASVASSFRQCKNLIRGNLKTMIIDSIKLNYISILMYDMRSHEK
jgi:hypothetical protein